MSAGQTLHHSGDESFGPGTDLVFSVCAVLLALALIAFHLYRGSVIASVFYQDQAAQAASENLRMRGELDDVGDADRLRAEHALMKSELARLRKEAEALRKVLIVEREDHVVTRLMLKDKGEKYDSLYKKYVLPARSCKGKRVVSIDYTRRSGVLTSRMTGVDKNAFFSVSESQLNRRLSQHKNLLGGQLCLKIIFRKGSQIYQDEAMALTNRLLQAYDYYYQEG